MKPLQQLIYNEIQIKKHITVERYMELALYHPQYGYYMKKDPFGEKGDFMTSPEISQMFGEIIGAWIIDAWMQLGSPVPFQLIECGAGRGTLMRDIHSVIRKVPELNSVIKTVIIECSPTLIQQQKELLQGVQVQWHTSFVELEKIPSIIIANEFFDALPIRQFIYLNAQWFERCIIWENKNDRFLFENIPLEKMKIKVHEGSVVHGVIYEASEQQEQFMSEICDFIKLNSGVFLTFDYGYSNGHGDTLQAVSKHKYVNVLSDPSENDITAHVNFGRLRDLAISKNLNCSNIKTQGQFLKECGIEHRAAQLINANQQESEKIEIAKSRLIDKDKMGDLFKVMAVSSEPDFKFIGF